MLRGSRSLGHFLWVTFLLGQQKKSDSSVGRRSKRPLRKRHSGGNTATGGQSHEMASFAVEKHLLRLPPLGIRRNDDQNRSVPDEARAPHAREHGKQRRRTTNPPACSRAKKPTHSFSTPHVDHPCTTLWIDNATTRQRRSFTIVRNL